ncbi:hypothetical protein [Rheinheimera maricola]|uniref:Uncharacterized protein n=1 Tax=Rheinheimera maricola TaxID=2793282 RepID=A0ABS7XCZ5_9GAMM|nr:hypothetical protein [Rheinheimera maricola]MBZ9613428.1 hypothetical protein [Rheinheimera maricola]
MKKYAILLGAKNIFAAIKINDLVVSQIYDAAPTSKNLDVTQLLISGNNNIVIEVYQDKETKQQLVIPNLKVKVVESTDSDVEGPAIFSFTLNPQEVNIVNERLIVCNEGFDIQQDMPVWSWQQAKPAELTPANKKKLVEFAYKLYQSFRNKDTQLLIAIQKPKLNDIAVLTEQELAEVEEDVEWLYGFLFNDDWALRELNMADIKVVASGHGRVFSVVRLDNSPLIRTIPPAQSFHFEINVSFFGSAYEHEIAIVL